MVCVCVSDPRNYGFSFYYSACLYHVYVQFSHLDELAGNAHDSDSDDVHGKHRHRNTHTYQLIYRFIISVYSFSEFMVVL